MTDIALSEDCGNSPKNQFVSDLTVAMAQGDIQFILDKVSDDIHWEVAGREIIQGKTLLSRELKHQSDDPVEQLTIHHALTHGKAGAVNGTKTLKSGKKIAYCLVFEFNGAKASSVKRITSYEVDIS